MGAADAAVLTAVKLAPMAAVRARVVRMRRADMKGLPKDVEHRRARCGRTQEGTACMVCSAWFAVLYEDLVSSLCPRSSEVRLVQWGERSGSSDEDVLRRTESSSGSRTPVPTCVHALKRSTADFLPSRPPWRVVDPRLLGQRTMLPSPRRQPQPQSRRRRHPSLRRPQVRRRSQPILPRCGLPTRSLTSSRGKRTKVPA